MSQTSANVAAHLPEMARLQPATPAIHIPCGTDGQGETRYDTCTFSELDRASNRMAVGLESIGIRRGVRTVLMVLFFGVVIIIDMASLARVAGFVGFVVTGVVVYIVRRRQLAARGVDLGALRQREGWDR